jgi:ribosomal protein S18 acetylase RimI-like enzyme
MRIAATIRPATSADAQAAASLIGMTMGRLADHLFAPRTPASVVAEVFPHGGHRFSCQFTDLAEAEGSVVGLLLSHPGDSLNWLGLSLGYRLLRLYGAIPFARFAARSLPLSAAREAGAGAYFVGALAVSPVFRGRGIGASLLARAEDKARGCRLNKCALTVDVGNNAAYRLYERAGYRTVGAIDFRLPGQAGHVESLFRMEKALQPAPTGISVSLWTDKRR